MFTGIASALTGLAGNIFSAGYNAEQQRMLNERQFEFQREMYQRQRDDALSDWHMQNEYNLPKNAMARLADAGLNPNTVYGSGGVVPTVNSLPHQAQYHSPNVTAPHMSLGDLNLAKVVEELKNMKKQGNVLDSEADKNYAEAQKNRSQTAGQDLVNQYQKDFNFVYRNTMHELIRRPKLENDLTEATINESNARVALVAKQMDLTDAQIAELNAEVLKINAMIDEIEARTDMARAQIITEAYKQAELSSRASLNYAAAALNSAEGALARQLFDWNEDTRLIRYGTLNNELSNTVLQGNNLSAMTASVQQSTALVKHETENAPTTGDRRIDQLLHAIGTVGQVMLGYGIARGAITQGSSSSSEVQTYQYDSKGRVTKRTKSTTGSEFRQKMPSRKRK